MNTYLNLKMQETKKIFLWKDFKRIKSNLFPFIKLILKDFIFKIFPKFLRYLGIFFLFKKNALIFYIKWDFPYLHKIPI